MQISRFTASKPSKSAIASVEKFTRQLTTLIARYFLIDAGEWDIELAYDGVHFSEEGHARFAEGLAARLPGTEGFDD